MGVFGTLVTYSWAAASDSSRLSMYRSRVVILLGAVEAMV